jgi:hypothetical protein
VFFLRKRAVQIRLQGSAGKWSDHDYAVVENTVIGRIYRTTGGPHQGDSMLALPGDRPELSCVVASHRSTRAKAALNVEYERWKARR